MLAANRGISQLATPFIGPYAPRHPPYALLLLDLSSKFTRLCFGIAVFVPYVVFKVQQPAFREPEPKKEELPLSSFGLRVVPSRLNSVGLEGVGLLSN